METKNTILTLAIISVFINLLTIVTATTYNNIGIYSDPEEAWNNSVTDLIGSTQAVYSEHQECNGELEDCVDTMTETGDEDTLSLTREDSLMGIGTWWTRIIHFTKQVVFAQAILANQIDLNDDFLNWIVFMLLWVWQMAVIIAIITAIFTRFK